MTRVRIGLLILTLLLALVAFGAGRVAYAASNPQAQILLTDGYGHAVPAGLFTYTDWDDHPGWAHHDWHYGHRGWGGYHRYRSYRRPFYYYHWGDNDDYYGGWHRWHRWHRDWDDYPGFYYFGWSFHD